MALSLLMQQVIGRRFEPDVVGTTRLAGDCP